MSRYSVQERFAPIGIKGQKKLKKSAITVIGLGALGSVASEQLVRAGIGKLILIDFDKVELSNLQRQSLYTEEDVGKFKVNVAKTRLSKINHEVKIQTLNKRLDSRLILPKTDLMLDCTDNIKTRLLLNDYAIKNDIVLISGLAAGSEGIIFTTQKNKQCLRCFLTDKNDKKASDLGILNTLTYTVASFQVTNALRFITQIRSDMDMIKFNIWTNEFHKIKIKAKKTCICQNIKAKIGEF